MALKRILDDTAKPEGNKFAYDIVGRLASGEQINGKPVNYEQWTFFTGDPEFADALVELYGGRTEARAVKGKDENNIRVLTNADHLRIILEGERAVRLRWVMWNPQGGRPLYESDGATCTYPDGTTEPDSDAALSLDDRLALQARGRGPALSFELLFRLADDPDLGLIRFTSGSSTQGKNIFLRDLYESGIDADFEAFTGPVLATISKAMVKTKAGREFTKTSLKLNGPAA
jgi:hypothetical protein